MPNKYEILVMTDPKEDKSVIEKIANSVFLNGITKIEKLEKTELAYKINGSNTAHYFLINVVANGSLISEFNRRSNITKTIWRIMIINLDTERGLNRKASERKNFKRKNSEKFNKTDRTKQKRNNFTNVQEGEGDKKIIEKKTFKKRIVKKENE